MARKKAGKPANRFESERQELKQDPAVRLWADLELAGRSINEIVDAVTDAFPERSPREVYESAGQYFRSLSRADAEVVHGFVLAGTQRVFSLAVKSGDLGVALRALKQLKGLVDSDVPSA